MKESIRMAEDRDKWRKSMVIVWPTLGLSTAKEHNRTVTCIKPPGFGLDM